MYIININGAHEPYDLPFIPFRGLCTTTPLCSEDRIDALSVSDSKRVLSVLTVDVERK